MPSTNYIEIIGFWGGIASIIALFLAFFEYSRRIFEHIKDNQIEQERQYEMIKKSISKLTNKATSHEQMQEVYIFYDSSIEFARHSELRLRMEALFIHVISIILFLIFIICLFKSLPSFMVKYNIVIKAFILLLICGLFYLNFKIKKLISKISKLNDSFSSGFLTVVEKRIINFIGSTEESSGDTLSNGVT